LIQGPNPIIPNIGIYLINICILIEQISEKFVGKNLKGGWAETGLVAV
jgi:hypothetical protein